MEEAELKLYYQQFVQIWEDFCRLHNDLHQLTCDEYMALLSSDLDLLEEHMAQKDQLLKHIDIVEGKRSKILDEMNNKLDEDISHVHQLLELMEPIEKNFTVSALKNLNDLLADVISKIQGQNKKNQIFLNKALINIKQIKDEFAGKKEYSTYGKNGLTNGHSAQR